VYLYV